MRERKLARQSEKASQQHVPADASSGHHRASRPSGAARTDLPSRTSPPMAAPFAPAYCLAGANQPTDPQGQSPSRAIAAALHTSGQPLDPVTRAAMEMRLGASLASVRVHTGPVSAGAAAALGAHAFTVGQQIFLDNTPSSQGHSVLAHELAHTVQQRYAVRPATGELSLDAPISAAERHAGAVGSAAHTLSGWTHGNPRLSMQQIQRQQVTAGATSAPASIEQSRSLALALRQQAQELRYRRYDVVNPPERARWVQALRAQFFGELTPVEILAPYLQYVDIHLYQLDGLLDEIDGLLTGAEQAASVPRALRLATAGRRMLGASILIQVVAMEVQFGILASYAIAAGEPLKSFVPRLVTFSAAVPPLLKSIEGFNPARMLASAREAAPKIRLSAEVLKNWAAELKLGADRSRKVIAAADAALIVFSTYEAAAGGGAGLPPPSGPAGLVAVTGRISGGAVSVQWLAAVLDLIKTGALDPAVVGIASGLSGGGRTTVSGAGPGSSMMMAGPKGGAAGTGGQAGGLRVPLTDRQAAAIGRLKDLLRRKGRWTELSPDDRSTLGVVFHKTLEALAERIYRGIGAVRRGGRLTAQYLAELRKQGGRWLFTETGLNIKGEWKRFDFAEIDFARRRAIVFDLTSVDASEHLAKTAGYREAIARLTGFPAQAVDMLYVGTDGQLLADLAESIAP